MLTNITDINESYSNRFKGYDGNKKTSYSPQGKAKIIIKHSKAICEDDKRFRNISSLFIENADGERFKLPFKKLAGARAMARHVTEGGNPYDLFGIHISEMVKDINTLGGFVRRSKMYEGNDEAMGLVETGRNHYTELRKGLKRIAGVRGYKTYKESWEPSSITEQDTDTSKIRSLFTMKTVNQRTEDALPLLARLQQMAEEKEGWLKVNKEKQTDDGWIKAGIEVPIELDEPDEMKEINEFEEWADNIVEGTWAVPTNPKQLEALTQWLSKEQPVGIDAMNATESLYNIIGDDDLYDSLSELAEDYPDADARPTVIHWIEKAVETMQFVNPNALKNLRTAIANVNDIPEGLDNELDADTKEDLTASVNKDIEHHCSSNCKIHNEESTSEDNEMKPFTEYVVEVEEDLEEEVEGLEDAKPDFLAVDKDDDKEEPMKKALDDKEELEEEDKEEVREAGNPYVAMDDQTDLRDLMQRTNFLLKK